MRAKVYLIRLVLSFFALVLPSAIHTLNPGLGALPVMMLYAPFLAFIVALWKGKIGPKLPPEPEYTPPPSALDKPSEEELRRMQGLDTEEPVPELMKADTPEPEATAPAPECHSDPIPADPPSGSREVGTKTQGRDGEQRFHLCPQCGLPSLADQHCCPCGYRLSPAQPVYRLCPDCKRFVPEDQWKCDCGHSFHTEEVLLHSCPACGLVSPYEARTCECGYCFGEAPSPKPAKPSRWPQIAALALAVALVASIAVSAALFANFKAQQDQLLSDVNAELADVKTELETTSTELDTAKADAEDYRQRLLKQVDFTQELQDRVNELWNKLDDSAQEQDLQEQLAELEALAQSKKSQQNTASPQGETIYVGENVTFTRIGPVTAPKSFSTAPVSDLP